MARKHPPYAPEFQVPHFFGNPRPAPRRTGPPSPIGGKALSMPPHDSFGPDNRYRVKNARPMTIKPDERRAVYPTKMQSTTLPRLLENIELMSQYHNFGLQPPARPEAVAQQADEKEADCNHSAIMF
jgi:hypothetical protein